MPTAPMITAQHMYQERDRLSASRPSGRHGSPPRANQLRAWPTCLKSQKMSQSMWTSHPRATAHKPGSGHTAVTASAMTREPIRPLALCRNSRLNTRSPRPA